MLTLKRLGHFFQNVILFSNVVHYKCNIFFVWNWSNTMNVYSALWMLMAWCFSTRASVATVLTTHPCVSRCLRVKKFRPITRTIGTSILANNVLKHQIIWMGNSNITHHKFLFYSICWQFHCFPLIIYVTCIPCMGLITARLPDACCIAPCCFAHNAKQGALKCIYVSHKQHF